MTIKEKEVEAKCYLVMESNGYCSGVRFKLPSKEYFGIEIRPQSVRLLESGKEGTDFGKPIGEVDAGDKMSIGYTRLEWLKETFPLTVKVIKGNPYGIPIGKILRARRKEGDGSPYPIDAQGDHNYQFTDDEVEIIEETK